MQKCNVRKSFERRDRFLVNLLKVQYIEVRNQVNKNVFTAESLRFPVHSALWTQTTMVSILWSLHAATVLAGIPSKELEDDVKLFAHVTIK